MVTVEPTLIVEGATEPIPVGFISIIMAVLNAGHRLHVVGDRVTVDPPLVGWNPGVNELLVDAPGDVEAVVAYLEGGTHAQH